MSLRDEITRRRSNANRVLGLFLEKQGVWISWDELAVIGGVCAWRTRVSDARKLLRRAGMGDIVWNKSVKLSAYKFERSGGGKETGIRDHDAGARPGNLFEGREVGARQGHLPYLDQ